MTVQAGSTHESLINSLRRQTSMRSCSMVRNHGQSTVSSGTKLVSLVCSFPKGKQLGIRSCLVILDSE
jgi:hypothetical protein